MYSQLEETRGDGGRNAGGGIGSVLGRHRGWVLVPTLAGLALSVAGAYLWPETYQSTASVRVLAAPAPGEQKRLPSKSPTLNERFHVLMSSVESRTTLQAIIAQDELYPNERKHLPLEDVIENMKREIRVGGGAAAAGPAVFQISFDYPDRFKAQKALQDLVAFLSVKALVQLGGDAGANGTSAAVTQGSKERAEAASKELEAAEAKLDEFRTANEGQLPEQAEANQKKLAELETRRIKVRSSISGAQSDQSTLQAKLVSDLERRRNIKEFVDVPAPPRQPSKQLLEYDKQIQALEQRIRTLKEQYTEKFPDVIDARQRLAAIKTQRDTLDKEELANAPGPTRKADPEAQRLAAELDGNIRNAPAQIAAKAAEINELNKEAIEVDEDIQAMNARIKEMPANEKQYAELLHDRDLKKAQFDEAEIKSKAAQEGQPGQQQASAGETLEQLEPPTLPTVPISPNRPLIMAGAGVMSLLLGLILAAVRELRSPPDRAALRVK